MLLNPLITHYLHYCKQFSSVLSYGNTIKQKTFFLQNIIEKKKRDETYMPHPSFFCYIIIMYGLTLLKQV